MDARFLEAWIHRAHTVWGLPLHPLCLDDVLLLNAIESPLLSNQAGFKPEDGMFAALICSRPYEEFTALLASAEIRTAEAGRLVGDCESEALKLVAYIDDFWAPPDLLETDQGRSMSAPWLLARAVKVTRELHLDWRPLDPTCPFARSRCAWTMPLGQVVWLCETLDEVTTGECSIVSEQMASLLEFVKRQEELEAGGKELAAG